MADMRFVPKPQPATPLTALTGRLDSATLGAALKVAEHDYDMHSRVVQGAIDGIAMYLIGLRGALREADATHRLGRTQVDRHVRKFNEQHAKACDLSRTMTTSDFNKEAFDSCLQFMKSIAEDLVRAEAELTFEMGQIVRVRIPLRRGSSVAVGTRSGRVRPRPDAVKRRHEEAEETKKDGGSKRALKRQRSKGAGTDTAAFLARKDATMLPPSPLSLSSIVATPFLLSDTGSAGAGSAGAGSAGAGSASSSSSSRSSVKIDTRSPHASIRARSSLSVPSYGGKGLDTHLQTRLSGLVTQDDVVLRVPWGIVRRSKLFRAANCALAKVSGSFPRATVRLYILSVCTFAPLESDDDITTFMVDVAGDATQGEVSAFRDKYGTSYQRTLARGACRFEPLQYTRLFHLPLLTVMLPKLFPSEYQSRSNTVWNESVAHRNVISAYARLAGTHGISVVNSGAYGVIIEIPVTSMAHGHRCVAKLTLPAWSRLDRGHLATEMKLHKRGSLEGFGPVMACESTWTWASGMVAVPCMLRYDADLCTYLTQRVKQCTETQKQRLAEVVTARLEEHLRALEHDGVTTCTDQKAQNALVSIPPGRALGAVPINEVDLVLTDFGGDLCRKLPTKVQAAVRLLSRVAHTATAIRCTASMQDGHLRALVLFEDSIAELRAELAKPGHGFLAPVIRSCTTENQCDGMTRREEDNFPSSVPLFYIVDAINAMLQLSGRRDLHPSDTSSKTWLELFLTLVGEIQENNADSHTPEEPTTLEEPLTLEEPTTPEEPPTIIRILTNNL